MNMKDPSDKLMILELEQVSECLICGDQVNCFCVWIFHGPGPYWVLILGGGVRGHVTSP